MAMNQRPQNDPLSMFYEIVTIGSGTKDVEKHYAAAQFFFEYLINTRYYKHLYNHLGNDQSLTEQEENALLENFQYIQSQCYRMLRV